MAAVTLYERERPACLDEIVGQQEAVEIIRRLTDKHWGGRAWWISGASGTGKTTLGRIIGCMGADDFFVEEFDSPAQLQTAAAKEDVERAMNLTAWGKGGRAFLINEAHGLCKPEIRWLLGLLERIPNHVVFVFTTTTDGMTLFQDFQGDALPLFSRCIEIALDDSEVQQQAFAEHCYHVAQREGIDGEPFESYLKLAQECRCNCRMMFQRIEAGDVRRE